MFAAHIFECWNLNLLNFQMTTILVKCLAFQTSNWQYTADVTPWLLVWKWCYGVQHIFQFVRETSGFVVRYMRVAHTPHSRFSKLMVSASRMFYGFFGTHILTSHPHTHTFTNEKNKKKKKKKDRETTLSQSHVYLSLFLSYVHTFFLSHSFSFFFFFGSMLYKS